LAATRVVEAILMRWDPIGVRTGQEMPASEYDTYAPPIVSMVFRGCSVDDLARHLAGVRTEVIGVEPDAGHDRAIAAEIVEALRSAGEG